MVRKHRSFRKISDKKKKNNKKYSNYLIDKSKVSKIKNPKARKLLNKIVKNSKKDHPKFHFKKKGNISIGYTKHSRSFFLKNKDFLKKVVKLSIFKKSKNIYKKTINKNEKIILKREIKKKEKSFGRSHSNIFKLFHFKNKSLKKYFIKELNIESINFKAYLDGREAFREAVALNIIKDLGFNTIPIHFAFRENKAKQSFIVYDYTSLKTLEEHLIKNKGKIKIKGQSFRYKDISDFSLYLNKEINKKLNKNPKLREKYDLKSKDVIKDISPDNIFIDPKKEGLYIFDPWLFNLR